MPTRKLPPDDQVVQMYQSGMSTGEIANKYGTVPCTVWALLRRLEVPMRSCREAAILSFARGRNRPTSYWKGKKQPKDMVEKRISKIRGERHWLWKGGKQRRPYRKMVKKKRCARCGSRKDLLIHHKDEDRQNNSLDNLEVLCSPCHTSHHKKNYWEEVKKGTKPPPKYGPYGNKARRRK